MSAPAWFNNAVMDGLQLLYTLNLPDRPAAEVLALTGLSWVDVLWATRPWEEVLDAPRLPAAFRSMAAAVDRWPAPKQLAAYLPPRAPAPALPAAAPKGPSPEARANLDAVTERLRKKVGHQGRGAVTPLTRGTFPAACEATQELARGQPGSLELS